MTKAAEISTSVELSSKPELRPTAIIALHLRAAPIHEQFRSRNVAGVVRCEKHDSLRNFIGRAEPAAQLFNESLLNELEKEGFFKTSE